MQAAAGRRWARPLGRLRLQSLTEETDRVELDRAGASKRWSGLLLCCQRSTARSYSLRLTPLDHLDRDIAKLGSVQLHSSPHLFSASLGQYHSVALPGAIPPEFHLIRPSDPTPANHVPRQPRPRLLTSPKRVESPARPDLHPLDEAAP